MGFFEINKQRDLDFIKWAKLKSEIHFFADENRLYFKEREIWWASIGVNIGHEQDGKNVKFERPVLILRKFGGRILWILPLTSKNKTGEFYYQFEYEGNNYSIILSQLRLISSKRLLRKIVTLPEKDFLRTIDLVKNLL